MKALLLIYAAGSYVDYLTTAWAIPRGAVEQNPFARHLIAEYGIEYLLYFKIGALVFYIFATWLMEKFDEKLSAWWDMPCRTAHWLSFSAVWVVCLGQWLVVAHNLEQIRRAMGL